MSFPDFLSKNKKNKKDKVFDPQVFIKKCQSVLEEIKDLNEERYKKLYRQFMNDFDNATNIQKKKLKGFYAQLVQELKALQGNAQERIYATGQEFIKKAQKTAKSNPTAKKVVKEVSKVVDEVTGGKKKTKKKEVKKKTAKKETKKKKTTTKKKAKKKASKK